MEPLESVITAGQNTDLIRDFTREEFQLAIKQMHPDKAPGPDGFNPAFFQRCWETVGNDIFLEGKRWLEEGVFLSDLNNTNVVLIPKVDTPQTVRDLRPISLCNVVYKIVSKVLSNRLKSVLPGLVDKAQSAFISGRAIQDNVIIAFEAIHAMKNKRMGVRGDVALKIDISKAYDRVDWGFLEAVLRKLGFSERWVGWMNMCVRSVNYSILVNEDMVGPIIPARGFRQGDPLSPYLFILCTERLSAVLNTANGNGTLHGIRVCRNAPPISHLMFADDCLLFCRATVTECARLKQVLEDYEAASEQAINFEKSGLFFSRNIDEDRRQVIRNILGVFQPLNTGRYLGLPSLIGREKRAIFNYIKDRL